MACQPANPPPPDGFRVWRGAVPKELTDWAVSIRDQLANFPWHQTWGRWYTPPGGSAEYVIARKDSHSWTFRNGKLVTGCFMGVTLFQPVPTAAQTSYNPSTDTLDTPDVTAATFDSTSPPTAPGESINWPLVGITAVAAGGVVALFWLALRGAGRASGKAGGLREARRPKRLRRAA